jgi:sporadic carbohydrate cluster protein (TIGR04323 family)
MTSERDGFRGYISSRPVRGTPFPQRVQNLVVRTYAARHDLRYKLSLVEYVMPGCFMMLHSLLDELPKLDGVILFSMFMLPSGRREREKLYTRLLEHGAHLHAALEDVVVRTRTDIPLFEDTIQVAQTLRLTPLKGRFLKAGAPYSRSDPFVATLLADDTAPLLEPGPAQPSFVAR